MHGDRETNASEQTIDVYFQHCTAAFELPTRRERKEEEASRRPRIRAQVGRERDREMFITHSSVDPEKLETSSDAMLQQQQRGDYE